MVRALVTGASGFIGTHLVRALVERGDEVTCLVRGSSKLKPLEDLPVQFVRGDVTAPDTLPGAVRDCDVIYHLAGLTKALTAKRLFEVNEHGTRNLLQACAARESAPVVVLVSSLAAAGPATNGAPREPHEPPRPVSNYGRSKLGAEKVARSFAEQVPMTILRPPIVIGEGDQFSLELFHTVSALRMHPVPGSSQSRFSVVHAADLVQAMILAAERGNRIETEDAEGTGRGIYFPADDEHPTFAEIGRMIARGLGRRSVLILPQPKPLVWVAAGVGELVGQLTRRPASLGLDKAREAIAGSWICSPRTAAIDFGFAPRAPLAERFRQTAQWYLNEGWL